MVSATLAAAESDWPQWRGPTRDGLVAGDDWPDDLGPARLNQLWRVELPGPSFSTPVVMGRRVYTTLTRDQKTEHVLALDRATGKTVWEASWAAVAKVAWIGQSGGAWMRSTPACDGKRLFVLGMRDVLVALDADTGAELWRVDFVKQLGSLMPDFGGVSSPLAMGDHVFVQAGGGLVKLEAATGRIVWRALADSGGKSPNGAFSTPILATIAGVPQLLAQTRQEMASVDPATGAVAWRVTVPTMLGMNILTPATCGESVFTSNYSGSFLVAATTRPATMPAGAATQPVDVRRGEFVWRSHLAGYMCSPVVIDGHAYVHLRSRRLACMDLADGKARWTSPPLSEFVTLVAQGRKILTLDQEGRLRLIRATSEKYEQLATARVSDDPEFFSWAHLAVAGEQIFVRDLKGLTALRWK
jgi:outer membrane protein assembly factor BamB